METQKQRNNKSMIVVIRLMAAMLFIDAIFSLVEGKSWNIMKISTVIVLIVCWLIGEYIYKRSRQKVINGIGVNTELSSRQTEDLVIILEKVYNTLKLNANKKERKRFTRTVLKKSSKIINNKEVGYDMEISLDYDETNIGIGNPRWMLPDIAFTSIYSIHMTNDGNHIKAIIKYGIMDKKDLIIEM